MSAASHTDMLFSDAVRFAESRPIERIVEAAASVANAIHVGAGGMIKGSLMEKDLRDALGVLDNQLVQINPPEAVSDAHRG